MAHIFSLHIHNVLLSAWRKFAFQWKRIHVMCQQCKKVAKKCLVSYSSLCSLEWAILVTKFIAVILPLLSHAPCIRIREFFHFLSYLLTSNLKQKADKSFSWFFTLLEMYCKVYHLIWYWQRSFSASFAFVLGFQGTFTSTVNC